MTTTPGGWEEGSGEVTREAPEQLRVSMMEGVAAARVRPEGRRQERGGKWDMECCWSRRVREQEQGGVRGGRSRLVRLGMRRRWVGREVRPEPDKSKEERAGRVDRREVQRDWRRGVRWRERCERRAREWEGGDMLCKSGESARLRFLRRGNISSCLQSTCGRELVARSRWSRGRGPLQWESRSREGREQLVMVRKVSEARREQESGDGGMEEEIVSCLSLVKTPKSPKLEILSQSLTTSSSSTSPNLAQPPSSPQPLTSKLPTPLPRGGTSPLPSSSPPPSPSHTADQPLPPWEQEQ